MNVFNSQTINQRVLGWELNRGTRIRSLDSFGEFLVLKIVTQIMTPGH
jgi:hypothetical protein